MTQDSSEGYSKGVRGRKVSIYVICVKGDMKSTRHIGCGLLPGTDTIVGLVLFQIQKDARNWVYKILS